MKQKLNNSKKNKLKLYKTLSIVGASTLGGIGLIGIVAGLTDIVISKNKNLGTDYGQGLNFNLQFSLNNNNSATDSMNSLQQTANVLSDKLFKQGLKQIKTISELKTNDNFDNFKRFYGNLNVNVDLQQNTAWYFNLEIENLLNKLNSLNTANERQFEIKKYANEKYKDEVNSFNLVLADLADNASKKIALYFSTETLSTSLTTNSVQPILNNTNNIELENLLNNSNVASNDIKFQNPFNNTNANFEILSNSEKNSKIVEINNDKTKIINFQVALPNTQIINYKVNGISSEPLNTKDKYWNLSGFAKQFNKVYEWEKHNIENPKDKLKTYKEIKDKKTDIEKQNPVTSWLLWTNRSGFINRINYIAALAGVSNYFNSSEVLSSKNTDEYTYWNDLFGDENKTFNEFNSNKKSIDGKLIQQVTNSNNEETKFYYWIKEKLTSGTPLNQLIIDFNDLNANINNKKDEQLLKLLGEFYEDSRVFPDSTTKNKKNAWLFSWNIQDHDLINSYLNSIDYNNFFDFFDLKKLEDVFEEKKLNSYNEKATNTEKINIYNSAFANNFSFNTGKTKVSETQEIFDQYTKFAYKNNLLDVNILNFVKKWSKPTHTVLANNSKIKYSEQFLNFSKIYTNFTTLSNPTLDNSYVGLNPWLSTVVGVSILLLIIGIIVAVIYRVPGAFASIMVALSVVLSVIIYRNLNLTFSFDATIALIAGIFIGFVSIINFLSYLPWILRQKRLNIKFGLINSFKYFVKNSLGIHITAIIIALVFLYFGQFQIKGFGAMLIINTLMSLIFNLGVFIGFVSIISFGLVLYKPTIMFDKNIGNHLISIELTGFDEIETWNQNYIIDKITKKLSFTNWWTWVVVGVLLLISLIGVTLIFSSIGNTNINFKDNIIIQIINNNNSIIGAFKDKIDFDSNGIAVISNKLLKDPIVQSLISKHSESMIISQDNNFIANMVVKSLLHTCLISMGLCLIWSMLWLNIVNIINVFVVQLMSLLSFGLIGVFQLPINMNLIIMLSLAFVINNVMIYSNFIDLKFNYKMKEHWDINKIKNYVIENQKNNSFKYIIQYLAFAASILFLIIFMSKDIVYANLMIIINILFNIGIIFVLIPYLFMGMMIAREKYIIRTFEHYSEKINHIKYDKVDEQEILGINKHIYSSL